MLGRDRGERIGQRRLSTDSFHENVILARLP
jgi:hypothetical protein